MPITITVEQLQKDTSSRWYMRPSALDLLDKAVTIYFQQRFGWTPKQEHEHIKEEIVGWIEDWVEEYDLERVTTNGLTRYRHSRDSKGTIALLEDQARARMATLGHQIMAHQGAVQRAALIGGRVVAQAQARQQVAANAQRTMDALGEFGGSAARMTASTFSAESGRRSNVDLANILPVTTGQMGPLGGQAYEATKHFVDLCYAGNGTVDTLRQSIMTSTGATANMITMPQLHQGMNAAGYTDLYFRQHCSFTDMINMLKLATTQRPMMVVSGGDTAPFRALVVTGHRMTKGRRKRLAFKASDGTRGAHEGFSDLYDDGSYVKMDLQGRENIETLLPRVGIIKFKQ